MVILLFITPEMPENEEFNKEEVKSVKDYAVGYAKYTGIAFQMIATIGVFTFAGYKLDQWMGLKYPILMIVFIFLGVGISMYSIIRSLTKS